MLGDSPVDSSEAAQFLMIGVITAIDLRGGTFHVGETAIVAEKSLLAGVGVGMYVEILGLEREGRRVASRVTRVP